MGPISHVGARHMPTFHMAQNMYDLGQGRPYTSCEPIRSLMESRWVGNSYIAQYMGN